MPSPDPTADRPTADPAEDEHRGADAEPLDEHEPLDLDAIERELAEIEAALEHVDGDAAPSEDAGQP